MITKVLLVENDLVSAKALQSLLKDNNMDCTLVVSGEEAISIADRLQPDIVLMDIGLDGKLNGIETAHAILEKKALPLIYTTEYGDNTTFNRASATLPFSYLTKPFSDDDLLRAINLALLQWQRRITDKNAAQDFISSRMYDSIFVHTSNQVYAKLYFRDILYLKAAGAYTHIFYCSPKQQVPSQYTVSVSSNNLASVLEYASLVRIHRSYYVNIHKIEQIETGNVYLAGVTDPIPVGERHKEAFNKLITKI